MLAGDMLAGDMLAGDMLVMIYVRTYVRAKTPRAVGRYKVPKRPRAVVRCRRRRERGGLPSGREPVIFCILDRPPPLEAARDRAVPPPGGPTQPIAPAAAPVAGQVRRRQTAAAKRVRHSPPMWHPIPGTFSQWLHVTTARKPADRTPADRTPADRTLAGDMLGGDMLAADMLAADMLAGDMLAADMLGGDMLVIIYVRTYIRTR